MIRIQDISFRWNYFFHGKLSGKYDFPVSPIVDRHRWVLSYSESVDFVLNNSLEYNVKVEMVLPVRGRTKMISVPIEKTLASIWPNLFAYGSFFEIKIS